MKTRLLIFILLLTSPTLAGWTPPERISDEALSFSPRIVATGDTLHVVYSISVGYTPSYYLRSTDAGQDWESPIRIGDSSESEGEVNPLLKSKADTLAVIWKQNMLGGGQYNVGFRYSSNRGQSWGEVEYVLQSNNNLLQRHSFCIGDTALFLIYSYFGNHQLAVNFARSIDWGATWSEPIELFLPEDTGQFDMVARSDTIHVVWEGRFVVGDSWETYYLRSDDGGDTWTDNLLLTSPDGFGSQHCRIGSNENGALAVIWMDGKNSPNWWNGDLFIRYSYDSGSSWTEEEQITFTHWATNPSILWNGSSIFIVWEDWRDDRVDIFYMSSEDDGSSWSDEDRVVDDQPMSLNPDIAVAGENIHVVWREDDGPYGNGIYYSRWEEEVGIEDQPEQRPSMINLSAYPNPFNGGTTITFNNLEGGEIEIYNIQGQRIKALNTATMEGKIIWDARDALGNNVSSGIYFARARGAGYDTAIKLVYLK